MALDEMNVKNPENTQMARDIALFAAEVVIYDTSSRPPIPEDYVRARRRSGGAIIFTAAPPPPQGSTQGASRDSGARSEVTVERPEQMTKWSQSFVNDLLNHISATVKPVISTEVERELTNMKKSKSYKELLLTGLAVLERRVREADSPTGPLNVPAQSVLERLQLHFKKESAQLEEAVALRYDLIQGKKVPAASLERISDAILRLASDPNSTGKQQPAAKSDKS
jgi:hypothetical protein